MPWSKCAAVRTQLLVIQWNVSTVLHQASAHLCTVYSHLTNSTCKYHIRAPEIKRDNVWGGWRVEWDIERSEVEKHTEKSQNSTQWMAVRLCPSACQRQQRCGLGLLAAWLTGFPPLPFYFLCLPMQRSARMDTQRRAGVWSPSGLKSRSNLPGHLEVCPPCYRKKSFL